MVNKSNIILGIDPGLNKTGWGVISQNGNALSFVAGGTIKTKAGEPDSQRLKVIWEELSSIFDTYKPSLVGVEEVFVNSNAKTSLKLGQARGIALLVPALEGCEVSEYTPLQVKKAVVGYGRAEKEQVQHMVKMLLPTAKFETDDTADALAVAIARAHNAQAEKAYG